jgi:hypothetical protein
MNQGLFGFVVQGCFGLKSTHQIYGHQTNHQTRQIPRRRRPVHALRVGFEP